MKTIIRLLLMLAATVAMADPDIPDGRLGFPLGTYLTISGRTPDGGRMKVNTTTTLMVEQVNGQAGEKPVSIVVENLGRFYFPSNTTITIRGYETGRMIGVPNEVATKESIPIPQAVWQFHRTFVFTSSVDPLTLPQYDGEGFMQQREERLNP